MARGLAHRERGELHFAGAVQQPHQPEGLGQGVADGHRACEVQLATLSMGMPRAIAQPVLEGCVRDLLQNNCAA